ncbi:unnamed protein product [Ambrosiozyma monospora]|uniref:Unnamed protein product n=1 Tax=Ambrosiozyma monospora TaxID=43982 RepID=A0ACB5UA42_AMBMO|nr:unnamed protein product [Ambrosiozyma monospora]
MTDKNADKDEGKENEQEQEKENAEEIAKDLEIIQSQQGHYWSLCQLTLLPVLDTRVKVCNCCGCKVYCGEMENGEKDGSDGKGKGNGRGSGRGSGRGRGRGEGKDKGKRGLREVVVDVCKVCLFCGGRFV